MIDRLGFERGLKIIFSSSIVLFCLIAFLGSITEGYTFLGIIRMSSFMSSWMVLLGISAANLDCETILEKRMLLTLQFVSAFFIFVLSYSYILLITSIL